MTRWLGIAGGALQIMAGLALPFLPLLQTCINGYHAGFVPSERLLGEEPLLAGCDRVSSVTGQLHASCTLAPDRDRLQI